MGAQDGEPGHDPTTGFFNKLTFSYMYKHIGEARRNGDLDAESMGMPADNYAHVSLIGFALALQAYDQFASNWATEVKLKDTDGGKPSLVRALRKTFGWHYMLGGVFKFGWSTFVITGAFYFVRSLLAHVNGIKDGRLYSTTYAGWALMAGFTVDAWFLGLCLQRMGFICMTVGIRVRAALVQCVTNKAFRLTTVRADQSAAIVNFVSSDIQKIYDGALEFHYLWTAPFEAAAILSLLGYLTNNSMLPGLGVILLVLPLQYIFGYKIVQIKLANAKQVAKRSAILQEVLPAIKLVKYYAWEQFFENEISKVRAQEQRLNYWNSVMKVINVACVFCVPPMTAFVIFVTYEFQKARLVSTVAFTTLSLFNILRFPLVVLPKALRAVSEANASLQRLEEYLLEEVPQGTAFVKPAKGSAAGCVIDGGVYHHPSNPNWHLHIPRFEVHPGQVVAVVGRIGAGKSSLIQALLGNMVKEHGHSSVGGRISYVPQNPWLQNLSIRDNVTFGEGWDERKYETTIEACALGLDLQILPQGDQSKAGIRGVNLSGGQRQRVNLARCAYADADLVLLDNALSAVDHHTAHHIFDKCIKTMFADKAVVLVTHQIEFMPQCDSVCIMDEGHCVYFGKWNEDAQNLLGKLLPITHLLHAAGSQEAAPKPKKKDGPAKSESIQLTLAPTSIGKPVQKEARQESRITAVQSFWIYTYNGNYAIVFGCFMFFLASQTSRQISDFWVRWWVADEYKQFPAKGVQDAAATKFYALIYLLLVGLFYIFMLFRGATFLWWVLRSSENIRKKALHNVLNAPMGFFLIFPVGDLLLNFTKDQDIMDENLPDAIHFMGIYGLILLATTITVSVTINFFGAFTGALIFMTLLMLYIYLPAATALKKARAQSGGRLVGLVAEVLEGLGVVQAFSKQDYFINEAAYRTDITNAAVFNAESLNLWLAFWCDFIGACLVGVVSAFAVGMKDTLGAATVGLAFSNIIQMLVFYTWVVRFIAESISLFNSVEGMAYLSNYVPHDGVFFDQKQQDGVAKSITMPDGQIVPASSKVHVVVDDAALDRWPATGNIRFEDVWMQYRLDAAWALKGVTFKIADGEKVGAVGRTGSGKSTTLLALYRMFELGKGRILVDGVDIATLSLKRLRTGLSIIPQEPVMFSGTVRSNLDPFGEFKDDAVLWEVLKKVGLEVQAQHAGGLEGHLVCLARAALRAVPILCLDEATAAMDPHTEQIVQDTIRKVFDDRTTITIAHRLDTIIESDKVLVMEAGELMEYAPPSQLLNNRDTMFSKLVDKTGVAAAAALRKMADEHFAKQATQARR
ncbi:Multidrug resistance-associated protein 1 [Tetrabaena socialis]|uniref:Multidrug resistance-associated protein 1 n=1 Tax=Tetrabaena socialis TaxID=47790 RepID=A0A2J8ADV3_9CHLO|nr:Multidrug resistance-associated protein 1 [Tetrabaena socialis]|eukprot:PNH10694.1 Multidrug resistance-associated protein 1 [Tetrabaena socialis]